MPLSALRCPEIAQFVPSNRTEIASALPRNDKRGNGRDFFFREKRYTTYCVKMFSTITKNPEATKQVGKNLGQNLFAGSIIALTGELGSGKTTLVQGIGEGLMVKGLIKSPSFVIINEYDGLLPLYHFDLYRLNNAEEILSLGYEEYLYEKRGIVVIEWAKRIKDFLPEEYLEINLKIVNLSKRKISGQAHGVRYREVFKEMGRLFCSC